MKVSELGEFGLIDLLAKIISTSQNQQFESWRQLIIGIGDDAAAWQGDTSIQLATTDTMTQDIHFNLDMISWPELGWKILAINLSDIAAMGGLPTYALVSLSLPIDTEVGNIVDMYRGMMELAQQFEVAIVGGNISRAPIVSITITVLGKTQNKHLLTRSAAKPGDRIAVTGYLGSAAAGLVMLKEQLKLTAEATTYLKDAFLRPKPRIAEGRLLTNKGVKTAIDISDGLVSDLPHICEASRVSARVETERLPIHPLVRDNFGEKSLELALSGGEDYELLFTASAEVIDEVKESASLPVTIIGEITEGIGKVELVATKGETPNLRRTGWDHFRPK